MRALSQRLTLQHQLVLLSILLVVVVAGSILASLRASTFEAFIGQLRAGLTSQSFQQAHRQRFLDLFRNARLVGSDQKFLQRWNASQEPRQAYNAAVKSLSEEDRAHPSPQQREKLKGLRQADELLDLQDQAQRFFLDQDPGSADPAPHVEYYGAEADLFVLAEGGQQGSVLLEMLTDSAKPERAGTVPIQFPMDIPEPHCLSLDDQPLITQARAALSRGGGQAVAGYLRYADGHLYGAVIYATPAYGRIPGGLVIIGDRVDDRLARQVSLRSGSASALFVAAEPGDIPPRPPSMPRLIAMCRGNPEADSNPEWGMAALAALQRQGWREGSQEVQVGGETWLAVLGPLDSQVYSIPDFKALQGNGQAQPPGWLVLLKPTRLVDQLAQRQLGIATVIVFVIALIVSLLSWALANQVARPIQLLSDSLLKVGHGDLDVQLDPQGPRDVVAAGRAFNQMLAGLRDKETLEKFVARLEELRKDADLTDPLVREQAQFGDFVVVERLGAGGMATVYKALPAKTLEESGRVALKVMHPHLDYQNRLVREYEVMTRLQHPGIVRVLAAGEEQERFFIAMEYVEGVPLSERLAQGALPFREFFDYADQLLAAVSYAHSQGIVHRDLKPDNIMVTPNGLKVMDFGLAAGLDMARLTASGDIMGTPAYVAPEQIMGASPDQQADQYSLGVLFFEMVAGHRPFLAAETGMLIHQHLQSPPPSLRDSRPDVPEVILDVVHIMLQKSPEARFPDLEAARRALVLRAC